MANLSKDCCICGGGAYGAQWWNRDDGYGICDTCAKEQEAVLGPEEMKSYYGVKGKHYLVERVTKEPSS